MKIDRRKNYYLMLDTETANTLDDPLVYDIGLAVVDKAGKVYECYSFIIYEIFCQCKDLMQTAYYSDKLENYEDDIANGLRKIVTFATARSVVYRLCNKYNIKAIIAHNTRFDLNALNTTQRYITASEKRYFLPYGIALYDTLRMARDTFGKEKMYCNWCIRNNYVTRYGKPRFTAEILYRYISGKDDFIESHTGLEDVFIEKEIFSACMRKHKKMNKLAFGK